MSLRVTSGSGFARPWRTISLLVGSSENDYVLYDKLSAAGHNPGNATFGGGRTVIRSVCSNGIFLGSTDTGHAAVRTHDGDTFGAGWAEADWQIIVEGTNTATIQGKGGAGGAATAGEIHGSFIAWRQADHGDDTFAADARLISITVRYVIDNLNDS